MNSVIKQALKPKVLLLQAISFVFTAISNASYIIMPYLGGKIIDKYASGTQDFKEINLLFIIAGSSIIIYFIYKIINLINQKKEKVWDNSSRREATINISNGDIGLVFRIDDKDKNKVQFISNPDNWVTYFGGKRRVQGFYLQ